MKNYPKHNGLSNNIAIPFSHEMLALYFKEAFISHGKQW